MRKKAKIAIGVGAAVVIIAGAVHDPSILQADGTFLAPICLPRQARI